MAFTSVAFCYKKYKCYDKLTYDFFKNRFTEPIEVLYLLMNDNTLYKVTSNNEFSISFDMNSLKKELKQNGHTISDALLIIHNHYSHRDFTANDINAWRSFQDEGFTGNFYLYVTMNNTIYELREDEDDS